MTNLNAVLDNGMLYREYLNMKTLVQGNCTDGMRQILKRFFFDYSEQEMHDIVAQGYDQESVNWWAE